MTDFIRPAPGPISSAFGPRNIGGKASTNHLGADIACGEGTAVVASAAGKVTFAGLSGGWGYLVIIDHGGGHTTYYAHLSYIGVRVGQQVDQGQTVGASGGRKGHPGAGTSTGPHLHTEHRINGVPKNPVPYWTSTASGGPITPIGEDMPLDAADKKFMIELGGEIISQLRGAGAYATEPLTLKAIRDDIGYRDPQLAAIRDSVSKLNTGDGLAPTDVERIVTAIRAQPEATVALIKSRL